MKQITKHLIFGLLFSAGQVLAGETRTECIGRLTFEVQEDIEWATFPVSSVTRISKAGGGGHAFSENVSGRSESGHYDYGSLTLYVTDIVARSELDDAANYIRGTGRLYQKELRKGIDIHKSRIPDLKEMGYGSDVIAEVESEIKQLEREIPLAHVYDHDLGIDDAYILGSKDVPSEVFLWRDQRIYYFTFSEPPKDSAERIKDLVARFRPRDLYEVPEGPGVCFPYGFIADDGKTSSEFKFSFRFTRTPNVIFSLLTVSPDNPFDVKPTVGTYDTDYRPGYDASKWKKSKIIERLYFGKRLAGLEGWRLDPKPGSGEQERAWFALAHIGGMIDPLLAVQVFTFQKGTDDLTDFTPPPEEVLPRLMNLTKTMKQTLDGADR
jgi:hypothetical protein